MKSEKELTKWLVSLLDRYMISNGEEKFRLEIQIETIQNILGIDEGTFEPVQNEKELGLQT